MKKVLIACDHGGLECKKDLMAWMNTQGWEIKDLGVHDETAVDYPDQAEAACREYLREKGVYDFGVLICGTGIGISIAANKFPGIRCALPQNSFAARMAKEHNNCQFIAFGGRIDYPEPPRVMLQVFSQSYYREEERHSCRISKLEALDGKRPPPGADQG